MAAYEYCTADVFTNRLFGGNPLAVVLDALDLDDARMLAIAREFGYSETTFVLPPDDARHTARVRIFTPGGELPFAGHPTVGTAFVLAHTGRIDAGEQRIVFEEGVGPVPVDIERGSDGLPTRCTLTAAQAPERLGTIADRAALAAMLGLPAGAVAADAEAWSCGVPFLVVPLARVDDVAAVRFDTAAWQALLGGFVTRKVYVAARANESVWRTRMFAPEIGVAEDPATGSAAAAFAGWLAQHAGDAEGSQRWRILQGVEMGRPSEIALSYTQAGPRAQQVQVGGASVLVARGTLML